MFINDSSDDKESICWTTYFFFFFLTVNVMEPFSFQALSQGSSFVLRIRSEENLNFLE